MKLNASKCTFGVSSGKFLGYLVNHRGIEANPEKIQALQVIQSPTNLKELQTLTGMIAALNRFISKCSDRCHPFFNAIKKSKGFHWDEECDQALAELKVYLSCPPLISIPEPHEQLYLYLSSSNKAVSAALIREDGGIQKPIYYISKSLNVAELNYLPLEKLVLALVTASRKLRHYFDAHPIKVLTSSPIRAALRRADLSGRMEKWSVELNRFHIEYEPRTSIKGQVLADFIAEFTGTTTVAAAGSPPAPTGGQESNANSQRWTLFIDGSATKNGSGVGIVLKTPDGSLIEQAIRLGFEASNNES
jgi:hypothetical protein